ncbi:MAG: hypothetical protein HY096_09765 [Nitrospinae bacterium]|nr:hypothetical protein [Nitrospinota bacterium]
MAEDARGKRQEDRRSWIPAPRLKHAGTSFAGMTLLAVALQFYCSDALAFQLCKQYAHDVKRFHNFYFGIDFPYEYSVAQLHKESLCRENILSSDGIGSEGVAQITFRIWKRELEREGIPEIKTISNHLRAQAYINKQCYEQAICKKLWVMYQIYNGGTLVNIEIKRAGSCDWAKAYKACKRRDIVFVPTQSVGTRKSRPACEINYEYSKEIFEIGRQYRSRESGVGSYEYW